MYDVQMFLKDMEISIQIIFVSLLPTLEGYGLGGLKLNTHGCSLLPFLAATVWMFRPLQSHIWTSVAPKHLGVAKPAKPPVPAPHVREALRGKLLQLSLQKFSSNVVGGAQKAQRVDFSSRTFQQVVLEA